LCVVTQLAAKGNDDVALSAIQSLANSVDLFYENTSFPGS